MNIEEIKAQIITAIQNKINDDTKSTDDKLEYIFCTKRLIGHFENEIEKNKENNPSNFDKYYGGKEEFERLKLLILGAT